MVSMVGVLLIATISTLLTIIVPGFALTVKLKKQINENDWTVNDAIFVVSTGFFLNTLFFLSLVGLVNYGFNQYKLAIFTYSINFFIFGLCLFFYRPQIIAASLALFKFLKNPIFFIPVLSVTGYTFFGMMNYPHVLDSGQLKWTFDFIDHFSKNPSDSTGAMGYSALIYFPGALFTSIPLVTLAAGFKIILGWLFILTIYYLFIKGEFKTNFFFLALLVCCFSYQTFSIMGLYELGKDSFFAVLFSILFITTLIENKENTSFYLRSGFLLFAACVSGAIVVPYLFVILTLYFFIHLNRFQKPFLFLFYLLLISSIALVFTINAMMKISYSYIILLFSGLLIVFYSLKNITFKRWKPISFFSIAFPVLFIILLIGLNFLMPLKVSILSWADALKNPIIYYYPPLDGKTTFLEYLSSAKPKKMIVIGLGFLGMLSLVVNNKFKNYSILYVVSLFPWVVLYLIVLFAHMKNSPFSGFNLWDMSKDINYYYFPFIFSLFLLIFIDFTIELIPSWFMKKSIKIVVCNLIYSMIVVVCLFNIQLKNRFTLNNVIWTKTGGDSLPIFAYLTEFLSLDRVNSGDFLMDKDSSGFLYFYSYQMYSHLQFFPIDFQNKDSIKALLINKPYKLAIDRKNKKTFEAFIMSNKLNAELIKDYGKENTLLFQVG